MNAQNRDPIRALRRLYMAGDAVADLIHRMGISFAFPRFYEALTLTLDEAADIIDPDGCALQRRHPHPRVLEAA